MSSCRARCRLESKSLNVCSTSREISSGGRGISTETLGTGGRDSGVKLGLLVAQPLISNTQAIAKSAEVPALVLVRILGSLDELDLAAEFALHLPQGIALGDRMLLPGLGVGALLLGQAPGLHARNGHGDQDGGSGDPHARVWMPTRAPASVMVMIRLIALAGRRVLTCTHCFPLTPSRISCSMPRVLTSGARSDAIRNGEP